MGVFIQNMLPIKIVPIILFSFALTACVSSGNDEPVVTTNEQTQGLEQEGLGQALVYTAQPGLTPSQRLSLAMQLLEKGEPEQARAELEAYLAERPRSPRVKEVIKQIDTPASQYYPRKSFTVTMQKGETISTLARDYLGEVFSFYALAKYNGITEPAKIDAGQKIRIPSTTTTRSNRAKLLKAAAASKDDDVAMQPDIQPDMQPESASESAMAVQDEPVQDAVADDVVAEQPPEQQDEPVAQLAEQEAEAVTPEVIDPRTAMADALSAGDYVQAASQLQRLKASQGLTAQDEQNAINIYERAARSLQGSQAKTASQYYFQAAQLRLKSGQKEAAIPSLQSAFRLDPSNSAISRTLEPLKREYADRYHSEASIAYRKQELDKAIALWNKVLRIDPDHSAAKAYLAQAMDLKAKLSELKEE